MPGFAAGGIARVQLDSTPMPLHVRFWPLAEQETVKDLIQELTTRLGCDGRVDLGSTNDNFHGHQTHIDSLRGAVYCFKSIATCEAAWSCEASLSGTVRTV